MSDVWILNTALRDWEISFRNNAAMTIDITMTSWVFEEEEGKAKVEVRDQLSPGGFNPGIVGETGLPADVEFKAIKMLEEIGDLLDEDLVRDSRVRVYQSKARPAPRPVDEPARPEPDRGANWGSW